MVEVSVGVLRAQVPLDHVLHRDPAAAQEATGSTRKRYTRKSTAMPPAPVDVEPPALGALSAAPGGAA